MSRRLLVRDQQGERERLLVGTMTVGRDPRCDISDADPLLSRRHAEFVCRPDSLVVRDLNSRNGIAVNGVKVHDAVLRPGDVVKVARLIMTYLGDIESVRPSSTSAAADGAPARPAEPPAWESPRVDSDSTRPMIREDEVKTATPVLPRSALVAAPPPVARPTAEWPPAAAQPPAATPLEDWSLELRPPQADRPSPHARAPSSSLEGLVLLGSLSLAVVAFALAAVPTLVWVKVRPDESLPLGTVIVVLGPSLLVALLAGSLFAWWLRRLTTGGRPAAR